MKHFEPKLWLGMTATPDKRDDNIAGKTFMNYSIIRLLMRYVYNRLWKINCYVHFIIWDYRLVHNRR